MTLAGEGEENSFVLQSHVRLLTVTDISLFYMHPHRTGPITYLYMSDRLIACAVSVNDPYLHKETRGVAVS